MATTTRARTAIRRPLGEYLALQYPFNAIADPDGGYVILFPDLPGCMTQVESVAEIAEMAEDARRLWIETEYEAGADIPAPSYPEEYSGKFNVRISKSLHRSLAASAEREGVSLNQYVAGLLARGDAQAQLATEMQASFAELRDELHTLHSRLSYEVTSGPSVRQPKSSYAVVGLQKLHVVAA